VEPLLAVLVQIIGVELDERLAIGVIVGDGRFEWSAAAAAGRGVLDAELERA